MEEKFIFGEEIKIKDLKRIKEIGEYNHNFYSYKGELILEEADDDMCCFYYKIDKYSFEQEYIGYANENDDHIIEKELY